MTGHQEVPMRYPFTGGTVGIDAGLVPVMEQLWARGIETVGCCQGNPGIFLAVICFREPRGWWESPDCWDVDEDDPEDEKRWDEAAEEWEASRPNGARQLVSLLVKGPWAYMTARWQWDFDDDINEGSALLLPAEDVPVLARALREAGISPRQVRAGANTAEPTAAAGHNASGPGQDPAAYQDAGAHAYARRARPSPR
jgi:hypothetical protein